MSKKIKSWHSSHSQDTYVKKAQKEKYRSRACYKLEEIDKKYKLIKPNSNILDLGSSPGSRCQYMMRKGNNVNIIAIDITNMTPINGVEFINMDIMKERRAEVIGFLKDHDDKFVQIGNIYHCERLFIIFSVYNWVCEEKENGFMNEQDVQYHLDLINKFIQDKVQLSWDKEDKLSIEGFA